jgi:hypothetical protein
MNTHDAVVDLSTVAIPLATDPHCLVAALGCAGLVHTTDGLRVSMVSGDDLLTTISELLFIPLDRFEETLQCPRRGFEPQGDRLGRFAVQIG